MQTEGDIELTAVFKRVTKIEFMCIGSALSRGQDILEETLPYKKTVWVD
jgi:hypothetical protein